MKKHLLHILIAAVGATAFFASCLKESEPVATPEHVGENTADETGASDRGQCSQTVYMSGVQGMILCGNIPSFPGSLCTGCGASYGSFVLKGNTYTATMINTCFTLINPNSTVRNVSLSVSGGGAICDAEPATAIPPGGSATFCITRQGNCCKVTAASCD